MGGAGSDSGSVSAGVSPLARIRKAIVAGVGAGVGAAASVITAAASTHPLGITDLELAIGALIVVGAAAGFATWRIPNAPA
jgi:hypothetical protein